jgi:hypothetical protein
VSEHKTTAVFWTKYFLRKREATKNKRKKLGARSKKSNVACHYSVIKRVNGKEKRKRKGCRKMEALFGYKW